ncbi:hypothetical protein SMD22_00915 (plasmid) [Brevibacillus halotolerans]|nr:hypothetical protein SMD22_00915 [Brevibacillus halotolerans]
MREKGIGIYHTVKSTDGFDTAANAIYQLVVEAQTKEPNKDRYLYIKIEGHRNKNGGFDREMYNLLTHFMLGFMGSYVKNIKCPMYRLINPKTQNNQLSGNTLKVFIKHAA